MVFGQALYLLYKLLLHFLLVEVIVIDIVPSNIVSHPQRVTTAFPSHILWQTARNAKVTDFDTSIHRYEYIVRFDVPMHHIILMQKLECL